MYILYTIQYTLSSVLLKIFVFGSNGRWRRSLHSELMKACRENGIQYRPNDKLELEVVLYLGGRELGVHDVNNRLKDIMDSLQGRAGGSKKTRTLAPIIANDSQIYKVTIEKRPPPKQSHGLGHLVIKRY
jgi:hypothetical protein